ncbi:MAG: DUF3782 domain-containing protein [Treponema sp.]|nr:DUF3782 domain-containing protein [Treponema sp.]
MSKTKTRKPQKGLTFEDVWAALMESREQQKENAREMRESSERLNKQLGKLGNRFGKLVEHLVVPNIKEKFNELGFTFEQISQNLQIDDSARNCFTEVDLLLENGDIVMAVEVKAKPNKKDVNEHVKRIAILRSRADARNDTRKFQGAIAGAIMTKLVREYIHETGFYAIEQTGDTVRINIPEGFKAREW